MPVRIFAARKEYANMTCPFCGHALNFLKEVLALTQTGTQCPKCWSRLSPDGTKTAVRNTQVTRTLHGGRLHKSR